MNPKIELRILTDKQLANIGTIQTLIQSVEAEGIVELHLGAGSVVLWWKKRETDASSAHVVLPLRWLTNTELNDKLEGSLRNFVTNIRLSYRTN